MNGICTKWKTNSKQPNIQILTGQNFVAVVWVGEEIYLLIFLGPLGAFRERLNAPKLAKGASNVHKIDKMTSQRKNWESIIRRVTFSYGNFSLLNSYILSFSNIYPKIPSSLSD